MKVVLIGSGNVATHLGKALLKADHKIIEVFGRSETSARKLSQKLSCHYTTDEKKISDKGDFYIIALHDDAIADFLQKFLIKEKPMVHTSGSVSINVFGKKFSQYGVLYPVQSFSVNRKFNFKNVPVCVEACNDAVKRKIAKLAKTITDQVHFINSDQRKKVHLAAVFANNFSNHLFAIAQNMLDHENISFDIIRPLILESALKVQSAFPLDMQTGPAKRGDIFVMEEHLKMLKDKKQFREIYKLMSESILKMNGMVL